MKRGGMHRGFLGSRKAVSALIATVLLLLITFSAVAVIWGAVLPMLTTAMKSGQACLNARVSINSIAGFTCYDENKKQINVMVNRGAEEFNLSGIQVGLTSPGNTKVYSVYDDSSVVLHMPFEEGSGTFTNDLSGKNNNGTISGGATWVQGKIGKALLFDGKDDYLGARSATIITNTITAEAWVYPIGLGNTDAPSNGYTIFGERNAYDYHRLYWDSGSNKFKFMVDSISAFGTATSTTTVSYNQWYHLIGTYDGSQVKIYVNGILENTQNFTGPLAPGFEAPAIGRNSLGGNLRYFNGTIDEVKIYNRALSAGEVKRIYEDGKAGKQIIYSKIPSKNEANTYVITAANITAVSVAPIVQVGRQENICGITSRFDDVPKCVT